MHELIPLQHVSPGSCATVAQIIGTPEQIQRLEELGIRLGEQIEMIRGGSPCIVRLAGHKLCFRESEALGILVRVGDLI